MKLLRKEVRKQNFWNTKNLQIETLSLVSAFLVHRHNLDSD